MVVYQHRRNDNNAIFYIGIGSDKKRAFKKSGRNKYWHHIVNKHGFSVEYLYEDISKEDACKIEMQLIAKYGRFCDGGILVNSSVGGDLSALGCKQTDEQKKERSDRFKGNKNPMYGKKRDDLLIYMKAYREKRIKSISEFNKRTKSKPIVAIDSFGNETIFPSQREAARTLSLDQSRIWLVLHGKAKTTGNYTFKTIS